MNATDILSRLDKVKAAGDGQWMARCPVHEDATASLSVKQDNGKVLLYCHAKCPTDAICDALGIKIADLFDSEPKHAASGRLSIAATYDYLDERGGLLYQAVRLAPKSFRQRRPDGNDGFIWDMKGVSRVPYRLPELLSSAESNAVVYVVEGEKDADRLAKLDLIATTNIGGAGKWRNYYNEHFAGRSVVVIPDNDAPGKKHAQQVAGLLMPIASSVKVIDLPDLPDKADVSDWLDDGHTATELTALADSAAPWTPLVDEADADDDRRCDDIGNAARFALQHGEDLHYCEEFGRWLVWDGKRWVKGRAHKVMAMAKLTARKLFREAEAAAGTEKCEALAKHAVRSQNVSRLEAMIKLARDVGGIPVAPDKLDTDRWLFNCENGTVNLRTEKLQPHNRDDLITKLAPVEFDEMADCDRWHKTLLHNMAGNLSMVGYLQRWAGMWLTGDITEQKMLICFGSGQNGKNVFLDTFLKLMGDYATMAPPGLLAMAKFDSHPAEIACLQGYRLVITSEFEENRKLKIQLVKALTGDAMIKTRGMREDFADCDQTYTVVMPTNKKPVVNEDTIAIWRRIALMPFTVTIPEGEQDLHLREKLKAEWPGILTWAVSGCTEWQANMKRTGGSGLQPPAEVIGATADYRDDEDKLGEFCEAHVTFDKPDVVCKKRSFTSRPDLWDAYERFVANTNVKYPFSKRNLYARMEERADVKAVRTWIDGKSVRGFSGFYVILTAP